MDVGCVTATVAILYFADSSGYIQLPEYVRVANRDPEYEELLAVTVSSAFVSRLIALLLLYLKTSLAPCYTSLCNNGLALCPLRHMVNGHDTLYEDVPILI